MFSTLNLQQAILNREVEKVKFMIETYLNALSSGIQVSFAFFEQPCNMPPEFTLANAECEFESMRPIHLAAICGDTAIMHHLLRLAKIDVNAKTTLLAKGWDFRDYPDEIPGETALCIAARRGHQGICEMLLDAGANPSLKSCPKGRTPLLLAIDKGHFALAEKLLYASPINSDPGCYSPLHAAIIKKNTGMMLKLLERGADVNAVFKDQDNEQRTPLDLASADIELMRLLLESGKIAGKTILKALEKAADEDNRQKAELLLHYLNINDLCKISLPFFKSNKTAWSLLSAVKSSAEFFTEINHLLEHPQKQSSDKIFLLLQKAVQAWPQMLLQHAEALAILRRSANNDLLKLQFMLDQLKCSEDEKIKLKEVLREALAANERHEINIEECGKVPRNDIPRSLSSPAITMFHNVSQKETELEMGELGVRNEP